MKSLTEHLWFEVPNRRGFVNITDTVEALVKKSGIQDGICLVSAMHITASVNVRSWVERSSLPSPKGNWILVRGNKSSTVSSMAVAESACW